MFLSANNFFWKVDREGHHLRRIALWRKIGRPEAALVGVERTASDTGGNEKPYVVQGATQRSVGLRRHRARERLDFGHNGIEVDGRAARRRPGRSARADPARDRRHDAEMTYYGAASGAGVFAAGALDFPDSIGRRPCAARRQRLGPARK